MLRSTPLAGLAMLAGLSSATAQRSTITRAFGVAFDPELRFTFTLEAGKATKVTLLQGGATVEGPRVP